MKTGDKIIVINSHYTGINPGDEGEITHTLGPGFGIKFTKTFPQMVSHVKPIEETRTIYFEPEQIRIKTKDDEDSSDRSISS